MKYTILLLFVTTLCFAQRFSFIYESKYLTNTKKQNDINNNVMILDVENKTSIFREAEDKKTDSLTLNQKNGLSNMGVEYQFYTKKDLVKNEISKIISYSGNDYLIPIDDKLNWKISSEQKKIGKYKTQKAEVNYGGRNWIAWFTTDLPFSEGPYIFHGLPGLIISIQDSNDDYSFNLIQVKKGGNLFDARNINIKIDWKKYENLAKSYYNDPYELNAKMGMTVTMTDANGNKMDLNEQVKQVQKGIVENDNPLELDKKINY